MAERDFGDGGGESGWGRKLSSNKNVGEPAGSLLCLALGVVVMLGSQWEQRQGGKRWGLIYAEGDQQRTN